MDGYVGRVEAHIQGEKHVLCSASRVELTLMVLFLMMSMQAQMLLSVLDVSLLVAALKGWLRMHCMQLVLRVASEIEAHSPQALE